MNPENILKKNLTYSLESKKILINSPDVLKTFELATKSLLDKYKKGGRLLLAGNGGSSAESQHYAVEIVSRHDYDRPS